MTEKFSQFEMKVLQAKFWSEVFRQELQIPNQEFNAAIQRADRALAEFNKRFYDVQFELLGGEKILIVKTQAVCQVMKIDEFICANKGEILVTLKVLSKPNTPVIKPT
jgi:hypothetical protein